MHIFSFLPFLSLYISFVSSLNIASTNSLQTTQATQIIAKDTGTSTTDDTTSPTTSKTTSQATSLASPTSPTLSQTTYVPTSHSSSTTTTSPNSTAALTLTPTTSASNAFESEWNAVTNWLSGSGSSSLYVPYWGCYGLLLLLPLTWL